MSSEIKVLIKKLNEKKSKYYTLEKNWKDEVSVIEEYIKAQGIDRYGILSSEAEKNMGKYENDKISSAVSIRCYQTDQILWKKVLEQNKNAAEAFSNLIKAYDAFHSIKKLSQVRNKKYLLKNQAKLTEQEIFIITETISDLQNWYANYQKVGVEDEHIFIDRFTNALKIIDQINPEEVYSEFKEDSLYIAETILLFMDELIKRGENNAKFVEEFKKSLKEEIKRSNELAIKLKID